MATNQPVSDKTMQDPGTSVTGSSSNPPRDDDERIVQWGRDKWEEGIDMKSITVADINNYITYKGAEYRLYHLCDDDLWGAFRDDFKHFTAKAFASANNAIVRQLRQQLRSYGVWVDTSRNMGAGDALYKLLKEEEPPEWIDSEVLLQVQTKGPFVSPYINYLLRKAYPNGVPDTLTGTEPSLDGNSDAVDPSKIKDSIQHAKGKEPESQTLRKSAEPTNTEAYEFYKGKNPQNGQEPLRYQHLQYPQVQPQPVPQAHIGGNGNNEYHIGGNRGSGGGNGGGNREAYQGEYNGNDGYQQGYQPHGGGLPTSYGKEITSLIKMYTSEVKYSGEGDNFDLKLAIFHDMCKRASVPEEAKGTAYPTMLRGLALDHYYTTVVNAIREYGLNFRQMCDATRNYFEGPEYKRSMLTKWNNMSLKAVILANKGRSITECLQILIKDLRHTQHGLDIELRGDRFFHNKLLTACQSVPACQIACSDPPDTTADFINKLYSAITTWEALRPTESAQFNTEDETTSQFFTDRRYHSRNQPDRRQQHQFTPRSEAKPTASMQPKKKACFICKKEGCWSTNHTKEEQEESKKRFKAQLTRHPRFDRYTRQYIAEYEGVQPSDDDDFDLDEAIEALVVSTTANDTDEDAEQFITSFGTLQPEQATNIALKLAERSTLHAITGQNPATMADTDPFTYISTTRYNSTTFYGVMIDTGASQKSTAGYGQYLACKESNRYMCTEMNKATAGAVKVQFGIGSTKSIGSVIIDMPIGQAEFHIVEADTPFLLCLKDMDRLGVYFNNLTNQLMLPNDTVPIIRRFGHPFMVWNEALVSYVTESLDMNPCFLTTTELKRLHRRFGHPSANRLYDVLERSGHDDIDRKALQRLTRFCEHCQKHGRSPGRFKFTLRDADIDFNHSIYVDIMYIDNRPVLHIIDEATRFQAARFLRDISTKTTWDALRLCWIDTYIGPPDLITHDAGKNFISREFRQNAKAMSISTKAVPVEAHWSIGILERSHEVLRRVFKIIEEECHVSKEIALQMAVKAVNDTAGPGGLVPTLLVFGAYPRMVDSDPPALSITERAAAIKKAMHEVRQLRLKRQVNEALAHRNGPDVGEIHDTPIDSDVMVWREGNAGQRGSWKGPFKLLGVNGETCLIAQSRGPVEFRSTVVKPFRHEAIEDEEAEPPIATPDEQGNSPIDENEAENEDEYTDQEAGIKAARLLNMWNGRTTSGLPDLTVFMTNEAPIQFASSRQKELSGLLGNGVFDIVKIVDIPPGIRIFNSRFVDEVKNAGTSDAFEKSRLVVQAYKDGEKDTVLTQSPTIQRVSQRLVLALVAMLPDMKLYLRDITQAYTQSKTCLNREFYIRPPAELQLDRGSVLKVVKPLYGVPEAGNHWYNTYHTHHVTKLDMQQSTYDPCLLYSAKGTGFGVVGLQTDDTIILADATFATNEEIQLKESKLLSKPREQLTQSHALKFNGGSITLQEDGSVLLTQERQCQNIQTVTIKSKDLKNARGAIRKDVSLKDQYVSQRARGAYVATVSQPEAAFDLSFAAQAVGPPTKEQIEQLNKRLQWQFDNSSRGLRFVKLDLDSLQLVTFTDASFANNKDLSSQIGYVIAIGDKNGNANILHWSSIKCKRVTRSVLASELYGMAHGFDIASAIKSTIEGILRINLPLVICTDSKSLYDCLVKLGTTQEKRLMVDILSLRQAYERREIAEIKWIEGSNNPADAMTKGSKACSALKDLIDSNKLDMEAIKWVERDG